VSDLADTGRTTTGAPLAGRSVVITRPREQAAALAEPLEALGAEVLAMPVLELADPPDPSIIDEAIRNLERYDWVVLTSANAVDRFFARLRFVDRTAEALSGVKVAAVGSSTAARMREQGVEPDLVPESARAEGLVAAFEALGVGKGRRVLIPRALKAREVLPYALKLRGVEVDVAPVYQTVPIEPDRAVLDRLRGGSVDCVAFTSGAIARAFVAALEKADIDPGAVMERAAIASIGPVTTHDLAEIGYDVDIEAPRATMASLAEAIGGYFAERPASDEHPPNP
jgi:uroporphyrinogen III methyltransferase/synthase